MNMILQTSESVIYDLIRAYVLLIWSMLWPLAFGFLLSAWVRTKVPAATITRHLGSNTLLGTVTSAVFGIVSSVCNYAVNGMARTLRLKGATWPNVMTYMIASTNLGITMLIAVYGLVGSVFLSFEMGASLLFLGAGYVLAIWLKLPEPEKTEEGTLEDSASGDVWQQTSVHFHDDVNMTRRDILVGIAVASAVGVLVPTSWWQAIFTQSAGVAPGAWIWNTCIGIIIAILTFGCSIGNVALAAVLWWKGVSVSGVLAFTIASLLTFPMLQLYRKAYGEHVTKRLIAVNVLGILTACIFMELFIVIVGVHIDRTASAASGGELGHIVLLVLNIIFATLGVLAYRTGSKHSTMSGMDGMGDMPGMGNAAKMSGMQGMDDKQDMNKMPGMGDEKNAPSSNKASGMGNMQNMPGMGDRIDPPGKKPA